MARKKLDLIGRKFGNLTVLAPEGSNKWGQSLWRCSCSLCGKESVIVGSSLTHKTHPVRSCSCWGLNHADLTGQTFGALTVLDATNQRDSTRSVIYKVRCSVCGGISYKPGRTIQLGLKSCGCAHYAEQDHDKMLDRSHEANIVDHIFVPHVVRTTATKASTTGYRWVMADNRRKAYRYQFNVRGKRYSGKGFASAEEAYEAAYKRHAAVIAQYGLKHQSKEDTP